MVAANLLPRLAWIDILGDDGVVASQAMQVAAGKFPYRDFFTAGTPAAPLLYGALVKLFGPSFLTYRLLTAVSVLIATGLLFSIGRTLLPNRWAALVAGLWGTWAATLPQFSPFHYWGVALALAVARTLLHGQAALRPKPWFAAAGVLAGIAVLFEQSIGLLAPFGLLGAWVVDRRWRVSVLPMAAGGTAVALVGLAYLLATHSAEPFLRQAVLYSTGQFGPAVRRPLPWLPDRLIGSYQHEAWLFAIWAELFDWPLAFLAPVLIGIFGLLRLCLSLVSGQASSAAALALVSTSIFVAALMVFVQGASLWLAAPLALLLVAACLRRLIHRWPPFRRGLAAAPLIAIAAFGFGPTLAAIGLDCRLNPQSAFTRIEMPGGTICTHPDQGQDVAAIDQFSRQHPGARVAYFPFISPSYMLTKEVPPVSNTFVVRGVVSSDELAAIETELIDGRVEWVVYYAYPWSEIASAFPNDHELSDARPWQFETFLDTHYTIVERRHRIVIYHLRDD